LLKVFGRGGDWNARQATALLKAFMDEHCDWNEAELALAQRVRPVIDMDVFTARDFNALIFPLGLRRMQSDHDAEKNAPLAADLSGMVFISTQLDFLEDWNAHH